MRLRRATVVITMYVMATTFTRAGHAWQVKTDNCRMGISPEEPFYSRGYLDSTQKRHLRVSYGTGVQPGLKEAFQIAMQSWNLHSETTRIVFEETTGLATNGQTDIWVQFGAFAAADEAKACALYDSLHRTIWYSKVEDWSAWIETDQGAAVRIFAHELGHVMNLDHKFDDRTVMREGSASKNCQMVGHSILSDIQMSDVRDAALCVAAKGQPLIPKPPTRD